MLILLSLSTNTGIFITKKIGKLELVNLDKYDNLINYYNSNLHKFNAANFKEVPAQLTFKLNLIRSPIRY